jgi:hypothetical protein
MSRWKIICAVLSIFILGAAFGLVVSLWIAPRYGVYELTGRELLVQRVNTRIAKRLRLSPAQEKAISGIVEETRTQLLEIRKETRPLIRTALQNARAKIRAQLNSAQQAKFDEMIRKNQLRLLQSNEAE